MNYLEGTGNYRKRRKSWKKQKVLEEYFFLEKVFLTRKKNAIRLSHFEVGGLNAFEFSRKSFRRRMLLSEKAEVYGCGSDNGGAEFKHPRQHKFPT